MHPVSYALLTCTTRARLMHYPHAFKTTWKMVRTFWSTREGLPETQASPPLLPLAASSRMHPRTLYTRWMHPKCTLVPPLSRIAIITPAPKKHTQRNERNDTNETRRANRQTKRDDGQWIEVKFWVVALCGESPWYSLRLSGSFALPAASRP